MKQVIKTTHIDTGGHGYLSVSKKDFLLVCKPEEITSYSGHSFTRMYLEEDQDATLFLNKAEKLGIKVEVKSGYNLKFKITHGFKPELFNYIPKVGDIIGIGVVPYLVEHVGKKIVVSRNQKLFRIPVSNPFAYITEVR